MGERLSESVWPALAAEHDWTRVAAVDPDAREVARAIVDEVRAGGDCALRSHAEALGDLQPGAALLRSRRELEAAFDGLDSTTRSLLERCAERIRHFARAQRAGLQDTDVEVLGGRAGSRWLPLERAACYAPGGRYPLPSSILMTVVTARVAGVAEILAVSPRPAPITLAAAHVAGADALLAVGGAQAIAACAFGTQSVPRADVIVGPGNDYVTAAKELVAGQVRIDGLAGPSELVVLADGSADPGLIAADLLAQAEHDPRARPILLTDSAVLVEGVRAALHEQLRALPTRCTAEAALGHGGALRVQDLEEARRISERIAPEHLELIGPEAEKLAPRLRSYGALFIGARSAEVYGDYGAGPNHVLPTGGSARFGQGLSVADFLALRTWLHLEDPAPLAADAAALARCEGLAGHASAALARK